MPIFLWSVLGLGTCAHAEILWTPQLAQAYDSVLALKMVKARELLDQEKAVRPGNHLVVYVEDLMDFVTLLVTENKNEYLTIKPRQERRLLLLDKESDKDPWQQYARAEILIHWALLKLKFEKSYWSATMDMRRSYKLLQDNAKNHPDFTPNGKTLGMMQVIVGTTPSSYKWLLSLLGISATVPEGMANLEMAAKSMEPQRTEAHLFMANAYTYILKQPQKGTHILDSVFRRDPQNVPMGFFLSSALMKEGYSDSAYAILKSLPKSYPSMPLYLISYQMGNILLYRSEYAQAIRYFNHYNTYYQGESNLVDSWYKMYLAASMMGNTQLAKVYKQRGLEIKERVTEADKHAYRCLKADVPLEPTLMQARLFCDGGYYQQAYKFLSALNPAGYTKPEQRAEYDYRMARIFTGLKQQDSAKAYYERCLLRSQDQEFYFLPNAALELGYILRDRGQKDSARIRFEQVLEFPSNEYSEGMERKAKAALDQLKQVNK